MRTCHCVGYMSNPGGVCCMELRRGAITFFPSTAPDYVPPPSADYERLAKLIGQLAVRLAAIEKKLEQSSQ